MATKLYLRDNVASGGVPDTHLGTNNAKRDTTASAWSPSALSTAQGTFLSGTAYGTSTVTGPTNGVDATRGAGSSPHEWISPPVSADVTISGTITANIWAAENSMNANVAINVIIEIIRANTTTTANSNTLVSIVQSTNTVELGTSAAAVNFTSGMTSGGYTSQTLNRGDRLRVRLVGDDSVAANMATGFSFSFNVDSDVAGGGDTWVSFSETFSFESAPAGSILYLTDTASSVSTASVDREAWTSRGAGVQTDVRNTATGWTAPLQLTDTAGGTVVDWFTRPLTAFTLTGMAVANLRAAESGTAANASLRCEIARVEDDGTSPTVWSSWCVAPSSTDNGELSTSEVARTVNLSGDDLAISDGQRLRIRIYIDDIAQAALGSGATVTFYYAGTSGGASGDSFVTLAQTVTEFVGGGGTTYTKAGYGKESA